MHPSKAHDRIRALIKGTPTGRLKEKVQEDEPKTTLPERVGDKIKFNRFSHSPKTGESVKELIDTELKKRTMKDLIDREQNRDKGGNMTEFVKKPKDKRKIDFSDLDINQPLVFDGGDGTVYIKNDDRHATSLETLLTNTIYEDDQCIPVKITKVEYKEE